MLVSASMLLTVKESLASDDLMNSTVSEGTEEGRDEFLYIRPSKFRGLYLSFLLERLLRLREVITLVGVDPEMPLALTCTLCTV